MAATKDDVVEAFLREGSDADPERVRRWVRRHPECRAELLVVASRLAVSTLTGDAQEIGVEERTAIRARALARANAIGAVGETVVEYVTGDGIRMRVRRPAPNTVDTWTRIPDRESRRQKDVDKRPERERR